MESVFTIHRNAHLLQVIDEERQLAQRRDKRFGVPFNMNPAGKRVRDRRPWLNLRLFTRRMSGKTLLFSDHASQICRFRQTWQSANCQI